VIRYIFSFFLSKVERVEVELRVAARLFTRRRRSANNSGCFFTRRTSIVEQKLSSSSRPLERPLSFSFLLSQLHPFPPRLDLPHLFPSQPGCLLSLQRFAAAFFESERKASDGGRRCGRVREHVVEVPGGAGQEAAEDLGGGESASCCGLSVCVCECIERDGGNGNEKWRVEQIRNQQLTLLEVYPLILLPFSTSPYSLARASLMLALTRKQ